MRQIFVDANVFFAAVKSRTGGSYFILELAKRGMLETVTVGHALAEAERNILDKIGNRALYAHYDNLLAARPRVQSLAKVPLELEARLKPYVPEKDFPILLGAFLSNPDALVTLDRKHFLRNEKLAALKLPFSVMTPGDFIKVHFA